MTFCPGRRDAVDGSGSASLESNWIGGTWTSSFTFATPKAKQAEMALLRGLTDKEWVVLQGRPRSTATQIKLGFTGSYNGASGPTFSNGFFTSLKTNTWAAGTVTGEFKSGTEYITDADNVIKTDASLSAYMNTYAADNNAFLDDFAKAWTKLVTIDRTDAVCPPWSAGGTTTAGTTTGTTAAGTTTSTTGTSTATMVFVPLVLIVLSAIFLSM